MADGTERKPRKKVAREVRITDYEGEDGVQWSLKAGSFTMSDTADDFDGAFDAAQAAHDKFDD